MPMFEKGSTKVNRSVRMFNLTGPASFDVPAGAVITHVYARNKSATALNLSVGNAAAGAQFMAATAVPISTNVADVRRAGLLAKNAIEVQPQSAADFSPVHITASAYPAAGLPGLDVTIEYDETLDSLPLPTQQLPVAY